MKGIFSVCCLLLVFGCGPSRQAVVVYSPHGPDVLKDYEARFEALHPEVDVQVLDMGSQEVYSRVRSEQRRPSADIWWGAPSSMFMRAADEGLLEPYRPTWAEAVPAPFKDPQDRWYGIYKSPIGIMFNTTGNTVDSVPQTWEGLLEPEWKGKVTIREPLPSGTMRTFIGAMILRAGSEDAGIEWLRKLHDATEEYVANPELLYEHMKRNPELITVWLLKDAAMQRELNGYPLDCVAPADTPVLTEGIAVIANAPHPDLAREFYEFVTSPEELAYQAHSYFWVPTREDLDPSALPAWIAEQELAPMNIDWQEFTKKEEVWAELWKREVYYQK